MGLGPHEAATQEGLARLMAGLLVIGEREGPLTVCDPYVRGDGLLAAAAEALSGNGPVSVCGWTPRDDMIRMAGMNLAVHGHRPELSIGSAMPWTEPPQAFHADFVVMNPPFNRRDSGSTLAEDSSLPFGLPTKGTHNYAWLQRAYMALKEGGRAHVLMPNKATVSAPDHVVRQKMIEAGVVEGIIALPPRLFPMTAVPVTLWILRRPGAPDRNVLFIDADSMGAMIKNQREFRPADIEKLGSI